jgi:hypothetical protein
MVISDSALEKLKYPIGKFIAPDDYSDAEIQGWIKTIEELPALCRNELSEFNEAMLNTSYRPDGWTARQVIHHIADSHMNAYIRFKLALTEETPVIKPYKESLWAELKEAKFSSPEISLNLLEALHKRFVMMLKNLSASDLEKRYYHPESKKEFMLKTAIALYSWHCRHHLEHIRIVKTKFAVAQI